MLADQGMSTRRVAARMTAAGHPVSHSTIVIEAQRHGLTARKGIKRPLITEVQKAKRLSWCRNHIDTDWKYFLFTDEAPFWQTGSVRTRYCRPGRGPQIIPSVKHPSKVHVWGGVCYFGKTGLKVMRSSETMTAERYRGVIKDYVVDSGAQLFGEHDFTLLHDGAPAHRARATQRWLEEHGVSETNDFPPNSPDLNIIEHIWAIMKHNLYSHTLLYNTRTLESAVKRSWNKVELAKIRVLVASMPRRIQACIDAEGGTTTY